MKVVAYSIKPFEKESLIRANQKKHDITLISNALSKETAVFAEGKDAVVIFSNDDASAEVIDKLAGFGVKYIATRTTGTDHIDKEAADRHGIKLANVPSYSPHAIAEHAVALTLALNRRLIKACDHGRNFDFRNDDLIGFNLYGKTVGIVGMGHIGLTTATIFKGFGCKVLGYDANLGIGHDHVPLVSLEELLSQSDIISLHVPLTEQTRGMINKSAIKQMKDGVMIINTARGALINTTDMLNALDSGKVGYLGLDVYEFEKGLFFQNHQNEKNKDELLKRLIDNPNVLITPHQAYLTNEALEELSAQTIKNLDLWQEEKRSYDTSEKNHVEKTKTQATISKDNTNILP
ncbi:MAG: 2-hydroxyacid dehydrogenase [Bacteroidetes bacterium]|nr:2-hydroxyacid dehydrogenase [Bacteroidota bacterium]